MGFADPQLVTVSTVEKTLPRTSFGATSGTFTMGDGAYQLAISHQFGKRFRRVARLNATKIAPDPLISAQNIVYTMGVYLVVDVPKTGYTIAEQKAVCDALTAWLSASSGAHLTSLLGGEV
jgi:hypothetical protein